MSQEKPLPGHGQDDHSQPQSSGRPKSQQTTGYARTHVCPRCGGTLILENQTNLTNDAGQLLLIFRRCIQCGNVVYPDNHPREMTGSREENVSKPNRQERSKRRKPKSRL
jgi:uncharacterized protein with PIN domain